MWWHEVTKLLVQRIGLNDQSVGTALIQSAAHKRVAALGLPGPDAYVDVLRSSAAELMELIEETVISESWFFRDGRPFEHLQEVARQFWASSPTTFRVMSAPCAGGEEAYSIAIVLLEIASPADQFEIDAVDISGRRLAQARRGVFSRNAFRAPLTDAQAQYFRSGPGGQEVTEVVRGRVRFIQGNLLEPDFLSGQPPYDAIWCRNLLIYLTESARQQVVGTLDRLLNPGGTLYVGHAETFALLQPRFQVEADRASFALRRTPAESPSAKAMPGAGFPPLPTVLRGERVGVRGAEAGGLRETVMSSPRTLPSPLTPIPVAYGAPPSTGERGAGAPPPPDDVAILAEAVRLADGKQHAQAIKLLELLLRDHGPSGRAYGLLGMIDLATGQVERAEGNLLKAVYLDAADEESLLALALISQRRGDQDGAERYRARARRIHDGRGVKP